MVGNTVKFPSAQVAWNDRLMESITILHWITENRISGGWSGGMGEERQKNELGGN